MCKEANENLAPMSIPDVIDAARELKAHRVREAVRLLSVLSCPRLSNQLDVMEVEPPSRGG
jgi:hypothetical protein